MKGMTTCKVCGRDFPLLEEDHYIARDPEKTGIAPMISGKEESVWFDTFDCPHCGCQNVMQSRKRLVCPCDFGICDECDHQGENEDEEVKFGGCNTCKFEDKNEDEAPCCDCNHCDLDSNNDYYKPKEDR